MSFFLYILLFRQSTCNRYFTYAASYKIGIVNRVGVSSDSALHFKQLMYILKFIEIYKKYARLSYHVLACCNTFEMPFDIGKVVLSSNFNRQCYNGHFVLLNNILVVLKLQWTASNWTHCGIKIKIFDS